MVAVAAGVTSVRAGVNRGYFSQTVGRCGTLDVRTSVIGGSAMREFESGRMWLAALAFGFAATNLCAQAPPNDAIERAKAQQRFHEQRAESDVKAAIDEAAKLGRTHPIKAVQNLRAVRIGLDLRGDLSSAKRDGLIAQLTTAILTFDKSPAPAPLDPKIALKKDENKKAYEQAGVEAKEVQDAVLGIARDYIDGKNKDAQRKVADIAARYPANPAVTVLKAYGGTPDAIAESKWLSEEQGRRFVTNLNNVQETAFPAIGDIEYPKDWKVRMERRKKLELPLFGPEEKKILEALEKPVSGGTKSAPFEESIQNLSTLIDQNIYLDKKSMDDLGVDLRKPVDIPGNVSARTALRGMLQSQGLTFIIKDKMLQVVSVEKARENMVTRSYEIRDLVQTGGPFNGAVTWGPYVDFQQTQQNAQMMMDAISGSIDPMVWKGKGGGPATITFHYPSMSLIIRAPSEVHSDIGKSLRGR